jgi:hypothetical protein
MLFSLPISFRSSIEIQFLSPSLLFASLYKTYLNFILQFFFVHSQRMKTKKKSSICFFFSPPSSSSSPLTLHCFVLFLHRKRKLKVNERIKSFLQESVSIEESDIHWLSSGEGAGRNLKTCPLHDVMLQRMIYIIIQ